MVDRTFAEAAAEAETARTRRSAFSRFYRDDVSRLVGFLVWQGVPVVDAADLAQEAMTRAYRYWDTIEHPKAWVRTVASRAYAGRLAGLDETLVAEVPDRSALLPPDFEAAAFESQEVLRVLRQLPARQRQVMAWTYDDFTPVQIAAELGITPEAVRSNLRKARRSLASLLTEEPTDA